MSARDPGIDLADAVLGGIYFIADDDPATSLFDDLANAARERNFAIVRIDLADCRSKAAVLTQMAGALSLPVDFGHNWDALSDCLRDLSWLQADGYALLIEHPEGMRQARPKDFDTLLDILDEAAAAWVRDDVPFFVFLPLSTAAD